MILSQICPHYKALYSVNHKNHNWGETKGEDQYDDVCVLLNKKTAELY